MNDFKNICKKFKEIEENENTSVYGSESNQDISPQLAKLIEKELIFTRRETIKLGNSIEDYFYLKLKKFLKANDDFRGYYSITEHIQKLTSFILKYVRERTKSDCEDSNKIKLEGINLMNNLENIFKNNSKKIQIDSFFPGISGKTVKLFYAQINEYSYSSKDFVDSIKDEKYYNLIVESTHCITSNINKKRKQLERYFNIFDMTKKLYMDNKEMLKEFYEDFLRYFKIIDKDNKEQITHEELINKSNFIYIICSNKNYYKTKLFQESMYDQNQFKNLVNELLSLPLQKDENEQTNEKNKDKTKKKENYENEILTKKKQKEKESHDEEKKIQGKNNQKKIKKNMPKTGKKKTTEESEDEDEDLKKEEENDYKPQEYLIKFKNVLNEIEKAKEQFLLIYLDSYDKLFIPFSIIKDGLLHLDKNYQLLNKSYQSLDKRYQELEKDYKALQLKNEEHNKLFNKLKAAHPELFE